MATKKITLKHQQPNGAIETRTTARAYTHVLLRKHNTAALLAAHEATRASVIAEAIADGKEAFADHELYLSLKAGDPIPYKQNQGGFHIYGPKATHPMSAGDLEIARKWHSRYGATEAGYVEGYTREALERFEARAAQLAGWSSEWLVISWHGSARNAKSPYVMAGDQFSVEEINNGVRA